MKKNVLKTVIFMEFVAAMVLSICVVFGCSFSDRIDADKQVFVEDMTSEPMIDSACDIEDGYAKFYFGDGEVIKKDFKVTSNESGVITISFSGEDL